MDMGEIIFFGLWIMFLLAVGIVMIVKAIQNPGLAQIIIAFIVSGYALLFSIGLGECIIKNVITRAQREQ